MKIYAYVEKGIGKNECQDRVLVGDTILAGGFLEFDKEASDNLLVAVADGVGGYAGGEKASLLAVDGLRVLNRRTQLIKEDIRGLVENINRSIVQTGMSLSGMNQMATTLTALAMTKEQAMSVHIGNCRLCTYKKFLRRLTADHTVVEKRIQSGEMTREEAWTSKIRNQITGCLGGNTPEYFQQLAIEDQEKLFEQNNNLIVTCDGIHDYIEEHTLENLLSIEASAYQVCKAIAAAARENGSTDDISIVIVDRLGKYNVNNAEDEQGEQ